MNEKLSKKKSVMIALALMFLLGNSSGLWAEGQHDNENNQKGNHEAEDISENSSDIESADESLGFTIYVEELKAGSPADEAGLLPGDKILTVDGESATSDNLIETLVRRKTPGDSLVITVLRVEKEMTFSITPVKKPFNKNYIGWELKGGDEDEE